MAGRQHGSLLLMAASARTGPQGEPGEDGVGVPVGGAEGQTLAKASGTDFDTEWVDPTGGGGTQRLYVQEDAPTGVDDQAWQWWELNLDQSLKTLWVNVP